ncbi:MAG TPA: XdhC family protein, partial [Planctomycetota bacterium]|nr:XdhC family protein [Planctomycetota bacterium]
LQDEKPRTLHFRLTEFESPENGLLCGGEVTVFIEALTTPTLLVFGGGHISKVLAHVASLAGYRVEIAEDREDFASQARFPEATRLHVGPMHDLARDLPLGPHCYVVVVTRGHKGDGEVLAALAARAASGAARDQPRYLGMIGSKVKRVVLFKKLREDQGVDEAWLASVRSPVGLAIGARSHEEIAIAIVAEMIQVRRAGLLAGGGSPA